jgi:hypothetical protein
MQFSGLAGYEQPAVWREGQAGRSCDACHEGVFEIGRYYGSGLPADRQAQHCQDYRPHKRPTGECTCGGRPPIEHSFPHWNQAFLLGIDQRADDPGSGDTRGRSGVRPIHQEPERRAAADRGRCRVTLRLSAGVPAFYISPVSNSSPKIMPAARTATGRTGEGRGERP